MSPSSSSNADSAAGPTFRVSSRALTRELTAARADESARDLGPVDTARLLELLGKLEQLDPAEIAEADPHLVVSGRRGRFALRPQRGHFLLRSVTGGADSYLELSAAEVPAYLDGKEVSAFVSTEAPAAAVITVRDPARPAIAFGLFALTAIVVAVSAWLTFRADELDPDSDYAPLSSPAQIANLRQQVTGRYQTGSEDDERTLEVTAAGLVRYRELGAGREVNDEREGPYVIVRRIKDEAVVLRVANLGPIEVKGTDTLVFARDSYQRRPAPGNDHR